MSGAFSEVAALVIFLFTYSLISFNRRERSRIELPAAALAGGALMMVTGILPPSAAIQSINWNTIVLVLGMMLIVASMDSTGFFIWFANLISRSRNPAYLLGTVCGITALLSAFILNDAVVLIFTPVVIRAARRMNVQPVPYLIMEAISANVGSAATEVGNPQNAYIASVSGVPFHTFTLLALTPTILSLAAAFIIALVIGRVHFNRRKLHAPDEAAPVFRVRKWPVRIMTSLLVLVFLGFYTSSIFRIPISVIALTGGIAALLITPFISEDNNQQVLQKVDWGILMFFIGLFILIAGVESSGLLSSVISGFQQLSGGSAGTVAGMTVLSAVLSNLTSNVPAVLLLSPVVQSTVPTTKIWVTLALSSTFAGNATIIGAAANVIVARGAGREGIHISLAEFMRYGLPITLVSLLFTVLLLSLNL